MRPFLLGSSGVTSRPLAGGDAGVAQTVAVMRQLVDDGVKDPVVNRYAVEVLRGCPQYNQPAEVRCIFEHLLQNFRYVQHPIGPFGDKQRLMPIREILALRAGDCPIFSELLAALLGTVGYETRFVTVAADPAAPMQFNHIYVEALVNGNWVALDAARPDAEYARSPEMFFRKKIWASWGAQEVAGVGRVHSTLHGYARAGMGDGQTLPSNPVAQDISTITTGIADVELSMNPAPGTVYANLTPNAAGGPLPFLTPGTYPYAAVPTAGLTISPTTLLLIGAVTLALLLGRRS